MTDPVKAVTDTYRSDLQQAGWNEPDIAQAVVEFEDSGGFFTDVGKAYGSTTSAVGDAVRSVGNILGFAGKNFTLILILVAVFAALWYFLLFRKAIQ